MVMLGCKPAGRLIEQHDVFFGIGSSLGELIPQMNAFWPEANKNWHIDAWREVTSVDGFQIKVIPKTKNTNGNKLFFMNLGGYRPAEFEEYHYKLLTVAQTMADAIKKSKQTAFYKHTCFNGAVSHIDDKYGVDVDDSYKVDDILADDLKARYSLEIAMGASIEDRIHIGYLPLKKI
jgi:hypothetical protein